MAYCSVIGSSENFASCLSNFQLDELLILQKSVERMNHMDCPKPMATEELKAQSNESPLPERMALMAADRGGDHHDTTGSSGPWHSSSPPSSWPAEPKPSKLQTLFQISITALAFLSFGGYLLCLIVQAIKSKGTTYFHPVATATTTLTNGNVKRIKIYRRSKRSKSLYPYPQHHLLLLDYATYMRAMKKTYLVGS